MDIKFFCLKCHQPIIVDSDAVGQAIPCPACQHPLVIPRRSIEPPSPPESYPVPTLSTPVTRLCTVAGGLGLLAILLIGNATSNLDRCASGAALARQEYDHDVTMAKDYERMILAPGPLNTAEMTRQNQATEEGFVADAVTQKNLAAQYDLDSQSTYAPMKTWGYVCAILSAAMFLLAWILPRPSPEFA